MSLPKAKQDGKVTNEDKEDKVLRGYIHSACDLAKSSYLLGQTDGMNAFLVMLSLDILVMAASALVDTLLHLEGWWEVLRLLITALSGVAIGLGATRLLKHWTHAFDQKMNVLDAELGGIAERKEETAHD